MGFETMKLNTVSVVDEDIFLLGYSEMGMVMQEPWTTLTFSQKKIAQSN